jgi:hypothetical protein
VTPVGSGDSGRRRALARLAADLASGRWQVEHADMLERDELDLGYCLITAAA